MYLAVVEITQQLHQAGLKTTAARVAVLRCLEQSGAALSHPEICKALTESGLFSDKTTIYRTLDSLHKAGIVHKVPSADRVWLFSLSEPKKHAHGGNKHVHFHCDACDKTFCMEAQRMHVDIKLDEKASETFQITSKELLLHGYCPGCATAS